MGSAGLSARPLSPVAGVEVEGLDVTRPLAPDAVEALRHLFDEYHLLLVRAQGLNESDHVRLLGYLGPVLDETFDGTKVSFVSNVGERAFVPEGRLLFHSDLAFCPEPLVANSLYAMDIPADGAPTRFANAERAAALLPAGLRARLEGLVALNLQDLRSQRSDRRFRSSWVPSDQPRAEHPVIRPHPRTGRPVLSVNELQTDALVGLDEAESERVLTRLFEHLYDAGNVFEHRWSVGDLVVWDNISLQHGRGEMPADAVRRHRRVVCGERGVVEQVAGFRPSFLSS